MSDQDDSPAYRHETHQPEPVAVGPATVLAELEHDLGYPVPPLIRQLITDATATPPATLTEAVRTPDIQPTLNKSLPSPWELAAREFDDPAEPPDL